ncbi:MAG: protein-methionine-sulfoxide reductase catalytic subunit MsrP [Anaerolineales bacterium]|nr:protein-methionine-sulfoxide reductase catalytic subunit MsrP [Chloroflexota bacterium]MBL6980196.1 protein-methionine-sulfoxide reductase catalytic subunit MsrP [Anaerolineales bacterium]
MKKIKSSEITPEDIYLSRRDFLKSLGIVSASAAVLAACGPAATSATSQVSAAEAEPIDSVTPAAMADTDELGDPLNSFEDITNYNNYYEFTTDKQRVAKLSEGYKTSPWEVQVGGLVNNPKTFSLDDLRNFETEERIYRMRCVEAWSMVIPWKGFPLSKLLAEVEPKSEAKYVRFETIYDPEGMPGFKKNPWYQWPYIEGLSVDEAMHDLTLMATGLYGKDLLPQNGAPVRLVVPWKYGFKSIKSIVKIDLVTEQPTSLWMAAAPNEYGFYANVNPNVNHPRWSQASERRIGELGRRGSIMFNGYEDEVAHLYDGMDLSVNY